MGIPTEKFFYPIYAFDPEGDSVQFLGCAFPVYGGFLTCRHVANPGNLPDGWLIGIRGEDGFVLINESTIRYPSNNAIDIAFIPEALGRPKSELFPIIPGEVSPIGLDVFTYGFFSFGGAFDTIESGYFNGRVVSFTEHGPDGISTLALPFPIIEGLSGSPILHYHHGVKIIGLAYGNRQARIVTHQAVEYKDSKVEFHETISRIVEFGLAYTSATIIDAMKDMKIEGTPITLDPKPELPFLN